MGFPVKEELTLLKRRLTFTAVITAVLAAAFGAGTSPASTRSADAFHSVVVATLTPNAEIAKGAAGVSGSGLVEDPILNKSPVGK